MVMKTFRVLVALAVMAVIGGTLNGAQAAAMAGGQTAAMGRAKPADKGAKTVVPAKKGEATKRVKPQEQVAKQADTPADTAAAPKAKAPRKKPQGDKPIEAGKNGDGRNARKKSA
jgi:hypothetical protein